jgi:hypothetical protein
MFEYLIKINWMNRLIVVAVVWSGVSAGVSAADKVDSFEPGKLWLDDQEVPINAHGGGVLVYGDSYYWFGEHKIAGRAGNQAQVGVHVYSSKDLYHWKDEGIALKVSNNPKSDITKGCILERPKVIFNAKTKKFVMWFPRHYTSRS